MERLVAFVETTTTPHIQVANAVYVQLWGFSGEGGSRSYCRSEVVPVHCSGTTVYSQVFGSCNGETEVELKVLIWRQKSEEEMRGKMTALLQHTYAELDHQKSEN